MTVKQPIWLSARWKTIKEEWGVNLGVAGHRGRTPGENRVEGKHKRGNKKITANGTICN